MMGFVPCLSILRSASEDIYTCSDESRVGESGGGCPRAPPAPANILCSLSMPDILFSLSSLLAPGFFANKTLRVLPFGVSALRLQKNENK